MARLAFPPFLRVFKDNGDVCTDATATWYDAGTTTLVDSYPTAADADAGTNPNTNPVAANSLGIFPAMWLEDAGEYKIALAGTGVTTKTVDEVYSTASLDQLSGDRRYLGLAGGAAYTTTGSSNAYVVTTGLATSSLNTYETLLIKANFTNTGAATLNVDGIGTKNIYAEGAALKGGEIVSGQTYLVSYDGTQFNLIAIKQFKATFAAHKASAADQTGIADATATKVTFATEDWDVGAFYDAANSKWTPPAGKVLVGAVVRMTGTFTAGNSMQANIYKNGSVFMTLPCAHDANTSAHVAGGACMDTANGTDYYEVYVFMDVASGTGTVAGSVTQTQFYGLSV